MDLKLGGKRALVTGASRGIGLAISERLADEGVSLALVARSRDDLDRAADRLRAKAKASVETLALDLSRSESVGILARACPDIDILVNNAGAIPQGSLLEIDEERWRAAWDLKVFGYINLTRACYALMKARGGGVILNIVGAAGERPNADYIAGSTANAALMAFTRALGGRSADDGIRVVAINPGPVETDRMISRLRPAAAERLGDAERWRELLGTMPFGRAATPDEIAVMAALLISDLSAYTTGSVVTIDGGFAHRNG